MWVLRSSLQVESALERAIAGDEDREDLEAVVDDVIEPKLEELEKQARANRKRELVEHGERYAGDELREVEGLDALKRLTPVVEDPRRAGGRAGGRRGRG